MSTPHSALPVFRIVTPSFNQAEYLEQTIRSVLEQEGRGSEFDLQYAVVDGGSTDGSVDIIRRYASELTYWCSERDRGQSHAINKGFANVQGDICAYINSDDYYLPGAFLKILKLRNENPRADLFHGICKRVDSDGEHLNDHFAGIRSFAQIIDLWDYWLKPKGNLNFVQPEVFWTKRLADRLGRFDEKLFYTMDFDYWLRGFECGMKVASLREPIAAFRVHPKQKTSARNASILELIDRIAPYLTTSDYRLAPDLRRQLILLSQLTRKTIESAESPPEKRLMSLLSLAVDEPGLLRSSHYWRLMRRNGKRVFWKRDAA